MNGEYVCELVRAHYDGDEQRFHTILSQIISSESRIGSKAVADRLSDIANATKQASEPPRSTCRCGDPRCRAG